VAKIALQVKELDLEYSGDFQKYLFCCLDDPGTLFKGLIERLEPFGVELDDLRTEGEKPSDRRIICELRDHAGVVRIGVAGLEVEFTDLTEAGMDVASMTLKGAWEAIQEADPSVLPKLHHLTLEFDCSLEGASYHSVLQRHVSTPSTLPQQTESAVVYYLPDDTEGGLLDSTIVLNRSELLDADITMSLSSSFDPGKLSPEMIIPLAESRALQLASQLDLALEGRIYAEARG
jgi:hypothetical protein